MAVTTEEVRAPSRRAERSAPPGGRRPGSMRSLLDQVGVACGQGVAGLGNLLFVLLLARVLEPGQFAEAAAFLALYLLVHAPMASLSAGGALAPRQMLETRRTVGLLGLGTGVTIAVAAIPLSTSLDLRLSLVLLLACTVPVAGLLALERGRLYGYYAYEGVVASLVMEPAVRLAVGLLLAITLGAAGAGGGVVAAGYASLLTLLLWRVPRGGVHAPSAWLEGRSRLTFRSVAPTMFSFVLLAVLQGQALLFANSLLAPGDAGAFAALSTLGGIAVFATVTVPLVLIPRAAAGERGVLPVALSLAVSVGAVTVLTVTLAPEAVLGLLFGGQYLEVAPLAASYVAAMALLGVARVLVADQTARTGGWSVAGLLLAAAVLQAGFIVAGPATVATIVGATLAACASLTVGASLLALVRDHGVRERVADWVRRPRRTLSQPVSRHTVLALGVMTLVGLGVRLIFTRGLWLDEAISVGMAQMSLSGLMTELRFGDVHPPGHYLLLWGVVRVLGTGELAIRLPSVLAGIALIPALYMLAREAYDRSAGLIAAGFAVVAPIPVWYAQEARMYAPFLLLGVLALLAQLKAIDRGAPQDWLLYAVATAGLLWLQYFGALPVLVQQMAFGYVAWRRRRQHDVLRPLLVGWATATSAVVVTLLPLYPILRDQVIAYSNRGAGLSPIPGAMGATETQASEVVYMVGANVVWSILGYHPTETMTMLVALWPLVMLLGLFLLGRGRSPATSLLLVVAAVPPLLLLGVAGQRPDLFELRYFIIAVPVVLVLMARGVALTLRGPTRLGAASLIAVVMVIGLVDQQTNVGQPRAYNFEGAFSDVESILDEGDILLYEPDYLEGLVDYYAPDLNAHALDDAGLPEEGFEGRVVLLGSFLEQQPHAQQAGSAVGEMSHRRGEAERREYANVSVWIWQ